VAQPAQPVDQDLIRRILEPVVATCGLIIDQIEVVGPQTRPIVRISVDYGEDTSADSYESVDSDTLAQVSRAISLAMDEADPIDSEYILEVSTPGAERELTQPRHWRRQIGRLIRVKLRDGNTVEGRLSEVADQQVILVVDGEPVTIEYDTIKKARPRVELGTGKSDK